ncbi:MAG: hypothetical protein KIH64_010645 [Mycobacterium sp.]|nr:hypothetical protein [Mycobacterium sp.]
MIRVLAVVLTAMALATAPAAQADPQDLEPECSSGQVAQTGECTTETIVGRAGGRAIPLGNFPGANPNIPPGLTPTNLPVLLPLGLTPRNLPTVLPLGLTPQNLPVS